MSEIDKQRELLERDVTDLQERIAKIEDEDPTVTSAADGTRVQDVDPRDALPAYESRLEVAKENLRRYIAKQAYSSASGG